MDKDDFINYLKVTFSYENISFSNDEIDEICEYKKYIQRRLFINMKKYLWEDYYDENNKCLKNLLEIYNYEDLNNAERLISAKNLSNLYKNDLGCDFSSFRLQLINHLLFSEIYEWAGNFRTVNLSKNGRDFCDYKLIESKLNFILKESNDLLLNCDNDYELASIIAKLYYVLLEIHPFREGNGRTIREFIREYLLNRGYNIDYNLIDKDIEAFALINGFGTASMFLTSEFYKAISPIKKDVNIRLVKVN